VTTDTGSSSSDRITSDTTLVLNGTAAANSTVTITRVGVGVLGTTTASGAGEWSFDYTGTTLSEGLVRFTATATDAANNTGPSSGPFSVTIDTQAPAAPAIASITRNGSTTITGTAEAGSSVTVVLNGVTNLGSAVADSSGEWTLVYSGSIGAGSQSFVATAADVAGNAGPASAPYILNTSLATPVITGITVDSGTSATDRVTNDPTLVLSGTSDAAVTLTISRDDVGVVGTTTANGSGQWTFDYTGTVLSNGTYGFTAVASDGSSSSASSTLVPVTVDTTLPTVLSINRLNPLVAATSATEVTFRVTFSESILGLDAADFALTTDGTLSGAITAVSAATGTTIDVTVGSLTGEGNLRLDLKPSGTGIEDTAGNAIAAGFTTGQSYLRSLTGNGTWTQPVTGGLWGDNNNWLGGVIAAGTGTTGNFNTLDLTADNRVHLDSPRVVGALTFGDTAVATPASWIVDNNGNAANVLTLAPNSGSPTITVNPLGTNALVKLEAGLAGTSGLTKAGTGTLTLAAANTVSGAVSIVGGILRLDTGSNLNAAAINLNTSATATLHVNGGSVTSSALSTLGASSIAGTFVQDSGSAAFNAGIRTNSDFGSTVRVNGGTFTASNVDIRRNSAAAADYNSGFIVSGGTSTVGAIGLGTANSTGALTVSGGSLTSTGPVTVAWQATGGRGGAMRVLGGTFAVQDTAFGLILARNPGSNPNNVATATFTGGVSTVEKITLGYDSAVSAGSATLTINGGALYLGSGGIVKNGSGTFATTLNLTSGILGAKSDWATAVNLTLPSGSSLALKAADASDLARNITLSGVLSGAGSLTKTGAGVLTMAGSNTYSGATNVNQGVLNVTGSVAAASTVTVKSGATLSGTGTLNGAVLLQSGSSLSPADAVTVGTINAGSLTWDGGAVLKANVGTSTDLVAITGSLTKGSSGTYEVAGISATPLTIGNTYTLASFGSTTFSASDFSFTGAMGAKGTFALTANNLQFTVTSDGTGAAAYAAWAAGYSWPNGLSGEAADADGDGLPNLLEFFLTQNPTVGGPSGITAVKVTVGNEVYPALSYVRRASIGDVRVATQVATTLDFAVDLGSVEVSSTPRGDGNLDVVVRSAVPLSQQPRQYLRLQVTIP
jgi:autotransporter-associated beta strand protein